jgi:arsenate reductase
MHTPVRVLFVCDGGTARSRMAATLLRAAAGERFEVYSAGIEEEPLNPLAVDVMRETGSELENTPTPALNDFEEMQFDYVISLCDQAKTVCLSFPRDGHNLHWTITDPTLPGGSQLEQLAAYRQARDTLNKQVQAWVEEMGEAD